MLDGERRPGGEECRKDARLREEAWRRCAGEILDEERRQYGWRACRRDAEQSEEGICLTH